MKIGLIALGLIAIGMLVGPQLEPRPRTPSELMFEEVRRQQREREPVERLASNALFSDDAAVHDRALAEMAERMNQPFTDDAQRTRITGLYLAVLYEIGSRRDDLNLLNRGLAILSESDVESAPSDFMARRTAASHWVRVGSFLAQRAYITENVDDFQASEEALTTSIDLDDWWYWHGTPAGTPLEQRALLYRRWGTISNDVSMFDRSIDDLETYRSHFERREATALVLWADEIMAWNYLSILELSREDRGLAQIRQRLMDQVGTRPAYLKEFVLEDIGPVVAALDEALAEMNSD